jgi:hypothetical protein
MDLRAMIFQLFREISKDTCYRVVTYIGLREMSGSHGCECGDWSLLKYQKALIFIGLHLQESCSSK